jgi:N6-adenosine-specific RNA methylase IME4
MKRYNIIYADPPWEYRNPRVQLNSGASAHYTTLPTHILKTLKVSNLALEQSVLFMWATAPIMKEALDVMQAWGYTYKTIAFTWIKETKEGCLFKSGPGYYTRSGSEFCLLGTRWRTPLERTSRSIPQLVFAPRTTHSEKPAVVRERITELYGELPRIELFSRHVVPGWDRHGFDMGDIRQTINVTELLEVSVVCDGCQEIYDFVIQAGEYFECPCCGIWYDLEGGVI